MPCYYDDSHERAAQQKIKDEALNVSTKILCDLSKILPKTYIDKVPEFKEWIKQHKKMDEKRLEKEKRKQQEEDFIKKAKEIEERETLARLKKKYGGK